MKICQPHSFYEKMIALVFVLSVSCFTNTLEAQSLVINLTNSTCESNGVINVSCSGCSPNVQYEITTGPICSGGLCPVSDDPAGTFASLPPGNYTVQAIANNMVETDTIVTILGSYEEPEPFGRAIFSCPGVNNGGVEIFDVQNGNDPFLYRVFPGDVSNYGTPIGPTELAVPFTTNTLYNNLPNGEYSYQVKDSCDVIRTGEVEITNVTNVVLDYITSCTGGLCLPNFVIRSQIGTIPLSDPRLASLYPLHIVRVNSNNTIDTVQTLLAPGNPDPIPVLNCGGNVTIRVESECGVIYDLGPTLIRCVPENVGFVFRCNANGEIYREYFYGSRSGVCTANVVSSIYSCGSLGNPDSLIFQGLITDFDPLLVQPDTQRYDIITDNTCTTVQDTILCFDPEPYEEEFNWAYLANCGPGESIAFSSAEPLEVIAAPVGFPFPLPYTIPLNNVVGYGLIGVPPGQYQIQRQICTDSILTIEIIDYDFDLQVTDIDIGCDVTTFEYEWTSNFPDSIRMWSQRFIFGTLNAQGVPVRLNVPGAFEQLNFRLEPNGQRSFSLDNELCPDDLGLYLIDVIVQQVTCSIDLSNSCYVAPDGISVLGLPCNNGTQSCSDGSQPYNVVVSAPLSGGVEPFTFEIFEGGTSTLFTPAITTSDTTIVIEQVCQGDLSLDIFVTDFCGQQIMSEIGANILSGSLLVDSMETICSGDTLDLDDVIIPYIQGGTWAALNGGPAPDANNEIIASNAFLGCFNYGYDISAQNILGICDSSSVVFELCFEGGFRIICPDSLLLSCDDPGLMDSLQIWLSSASVEGICDTSSTNANVTTNLLSSTSNANFVSIDTYEFVATDNFGNTTSCEAVFASFDTVSPVVIIPNDTIIYDCPSNYETYIDDWLAQFSVMDNCSEFTINSVLESIDEPCQGEQGYIQLIYSFSAEDEFGNHASDSMLQATFTVIDTILPIITSPNDLILACGTEQLAQVIIWLDQYEVTETCQSYEVTNDWDGSLPSVCFADSLPVTFTVTDACGATATSISNIVIEMDTVGPVFDQCPLTPIIVDAPETWCSAFVNYTLPGASSLCSSVDIEQTDSTGLESGDLFPVGLTVLELTATDSCGNSTVCALKIFVNDYHAAPMITCPLDLTVTADINSCYALVDNIEPDTILDNCPNNTFIFHEIIDDNGVTIGEGLGDASGNVFPLGESQITYTVIDQPLLLISEILQDSSKTGIELVNFGPSDLNISCLEIRITDAQDSIQNYIIPNNTILVAGDVFTYQFPMPTLIGTSLDYTIRIMDYVIDSVRSNVTNIVGENIIRISPIDNNVASDWKVVNTCGSGSFGFYNLEFPAVQSNGFLTSLQSEPPSESSCTFKVTVIDVQAPICSSFESTEYTLSNENFGPTFCYQASIVLESGIIEDINITNLSIDFDSTSDIKIQLISPSGTTIDLLDMNCTTSSDINLSLDDAATMTLNQAACNPYGMGGNFQPMEALSIFNEENAAGTWILSIESSVEQTGTINNMTIEIVESMPFAQADVLIPNDLGLCGANYNWTHPAFGDCSGGTMTVIYSFDNIITGHSTTEALVLIDSLGLINDAGQSVSRFFEVGITTIQYFLEDEFGNQSSCSFIVEVEDNEAPTIQNDCIDITISLDGGDCTGSIVQQTNVTDNCEIDSFTYLSNGIPIDVTVLEIGIHVIDLVVVDIYGNIMTCNFSVEVIGNEQQGTQLVCNNNINISLDQNCEAVLTADMLLEGNNYACYDNYCIVVRDSNGMIVNNIFDLDDINSTFEVTIQDCNNSGNECWGYVTIEYKLIPEIQCPDTTSIYCSGNAEALYPIGHPLEGQLITGELELLSCVADPVISYSDNHVDLGECASPRAYIERIWTLEYGINQIVSCVQIINILPFDASLLEFPIDYNLNNALSCSAVNQDPSLTDPSNTDYPTLEGYSIYGAQFCDINMGYWDETLYDVYCPSAYEILRHWTISNECEPIEIGINPIVHVQRIKVEDKEAPIISGLDDITISTDPWECYGTYSLPTVEALDDCGEVQIEWSASYGLFVGNTVTNLLPGETIITAKATDDCGNFNITSFTITTVDKVPPQIVAETSHSISLSSDGVAKLFAKDLDDGSHDACGNIYFNVKRMDNGPECNFDKFPPAGNDNAQFNEAVFFCCDDVSDEPVLVQFQVCDAAGNCNIAMINIFVQDKLAPQIICPSPMTISCNDLVGLDLDDTELLDALFGEAQAAGTCNVTVTQTAVGNELCGEGVIFRNFTASNDAGTSSCQQMITVNSSTESQLTCVRISFVDLNNNIYNWCAVNDNQNNNNDDLPALEVDCTDGINVPELTIDMNGLCTEAGQNITLDSFLFAGGACKKYIIHYEVIDQCLFDENYVDPITGEIDPYQSDNGYFEMYIEVDAFDNEAPTLDCVNLSFIANSCSGYNGTIGMTGTDNCTDPIYFGKLWRLDLDADDTIDYPIIGWENTAEVSPIIAGINEFPLGTHRIFWIVSDGCGNDETCSQLITITEEDKAPTPYCFDGLSTAFMESTGTVSLWANDFNAGSFDNCDGALLLSIIPEQDVEGLLEDGAYAQSFDHPNVTQQTNGDWGFQFDCSYIPNGVSAIIEVRIYVTDAAGNYDYCTATLRLEDNLDGCLNDDSGMLKISGEIQTESGEKVELVAMSLDANFVEFPKTDTTVKDGFYSFDNLFEMIDYSITPRRNDDHLNGVSTLDIVQAQKHILGLEILESPYQLIAADVNSDCQITGQDLVQMRKLILGKYTNDEFPENTSWRFITDDFSFTTGQQPCLFDEMEELPELMESAEENFYAVKIGDLNGSANANLVQQVEIRTNPMESLNIVNRSLKKGSEYRIPVYSNSIQDFYGFQVAFVGNGIEFIGITPGILNVQASDISWSTDKLLLSIIEARGINLNEDEALFTITIKANEDLKLHDAILIDEQSKRSFESEMYYGQLIQVADIELVFKDQDSKALISDIIVHQNEPNPFSSETIIRIEIPEKSEGIFQVYDLKGSMLYEETRWFEKGDQFIKLTKDQLKTEGILFYSLQIGDQYFKKKMILVE